MKMMN